MRKLATVKEVKGGQREGGAGRWVREGSECFPAVSPQPKVHAQPQRVTSACSCAKTFVLFTTLVCHGEQLG